MRSRGPQVRFKVVAVPARAPFFICSDSRLMRDGVCKSPRCFLRCNNCVFELHSNYPETARRVCMCGMNGQCVLGQ